MAEFHEVTSTNPIEAIDVLFNKALKIVPELSTTQLDAAHKRMVQSWGDLPFLEGTEETIKNLILKNAIVHSNIAVFKRFTINVCLADKGYEGEEAAQIWAWVGAMGLVVHLWKTKDKVHAFGRPDLLE